MKINFAKLKDEGFQFFNQPNEIALMAPVEFEGPLFCASLLRWDTPIKIGAFSNLNHNNEIGHAELGRYVTVGQNCFVGGDKHPVDWLTSSRIIYIDDFRGFASYTEKNPKRFAEFSETGSPVVIGNDVLITNSCIISRGVRIGDGAIIAPGSVVTKDVPPYSIVGGNPAKVIRKRFSDEIIEKLLNIKWWRYNIYDLNGLKLNNIEEFIEGFDEYANNLSEFNPKKYSKDSLIENFKSN